MKSPNIKAYALKKYQQGLTAKEIVILIQGMHGVVVNRVTVGRWIKQRRQSENIVN